MKADTKQPPLRTSPGTLPGASLRQQNIRLLWPAIVLMFLSGLTVGIGIGAFVVGPLRLPWSWLQYPALFAQIGVLIILAVYVRSALSRMDRIHLGIRGEMAVAEALQPLIIDGYRILHDLPYDNTKETGPNIDHVAIGPGGIFTIETKCRSKTKGANEKITVIGEQLSINGREICERAVGQTLGNARRIEQILSQVTGRAVKSQPVLVFAGKWWIQPRPDEQRGPLRVMNEKMMISWIKDKPRLLTPEDIALYTTRLREYADRD